MVVGSHKIRSSWRTPEVPTTPMYLSRMLEQNKYPIHRFPCNTTVSSLFQYVIYFLTVSYVVFFSNISRNIKLLQEQLLPMYQQHGRQKNLSRKGKRGQLAASGNKSVWRWRVQREYCNVLSQIKILAWFIKLRHWNDCNRTNSEFISELPTKFYMNPKWTPYFPSSVLKCLYNTQVQ